MNCSPKSFSVGLLAAASCLLAVSALPAAHAQTGEGAPAAPPVPSAPAPKNVTLDVRDAPLRQVLMQLFDKAKIDYALDNAVSGFVTIKVTNQPIDTVLRLILRSSETPLTYTITNGVYEIKPRTLAAAQPATLNVGIPPETAPLVASSDGPHLAVINLTYLDPFDLQGLLGVILVPSGSRGFGGAAASGAGAPPIPGGQAGGNNGSPNGSGANSPPIGTVGSNGTGGRIIGGGR